MSEPVPSSVASGHGDRSAEEFAVTGLTCDHCVRAVTEELSDVSGVSGVEVQLVPGGVSSLRVTTEGSLDRGQIEEAVRRAGYATGGAQ